MHGKFLVESEVDRSEWYTHETKVLFFLAFKAAEYERKELLENLKFESILDSILSRKTFSGKNVIGMVKRGKKKKQGKAVSFREAHSNAIEWLFVYLFIHFKKVLMWSLNPVSSNVLLHGHTNIIFRCTVACTRSAAINLAAILWWANFPRLQFVVSSNYGCGWRYDNEITGP